MKLPKTIGVAVCAGVVASLALAGDDSKTAPQTPVTGTIKGQIVFDGEVPKIKPITIGAEVAKGCCDTGGCPSSGNVADDDRSLIIAEKGGIENVVVTLTVEGAERPKIPEEPRMLDQKGCRFSTRVMIIPMGATVAYANSDAVSHNIHTYAIKNEGINITVAGGKNSAQKLEKAEAVKVTCDIHTWMASYVYVTDATHWDLTDAEGNFEIEDLPPGTYKLALWHEKLGKAKAEVTVGEDGSVPPVKIKMGAKKKKKGRRGR